MSTSIPQLPATAYPGLKLGLTNAFASGPGTHVHEGHVVASLLGEPSLLPASTSNTKSNKHASTKAIITIPRLLPSPLHAGTPSPHVSNTNILPSVTSLVLARVLRVRPRQVDLGILCVSTKSPSTDTTTTPKPSDTTSGTTTSYYDTTSFHVNSDAYPATIRREDIRATEKDKIVCADMFRVGDVVRGEIISVGDQANYYVSTARNELGVLVAKSEVTGELMAPVSWKEFVEVGTGRREGRKVAKPF